VDGHPQSWWYREGWHTKAVCGLLEAEWGLTTGWLPNATVDEIIDGIGKARFITTINLARGYWQVPVAVGVRAATAFTTPFSLGSCPLCPVTFQRLMDHLIYGLKSFAAAYLDDVVIYYT